MNESPRCTSHSYIHTSYLHRTRRIQHIDRASEILRGDGLHRYSALCLSSLHGSPDDPTNPPDCAGNAEHIDTYLAPCHGLGRRAPVSCHPASTSQPTRALRLIRRPPDISHLQRMSLFASPSHPPHPTNRELPSFPLASAVERGQCRSFPASNVAETNISMAVLSRSGPVARVSALSTHSAGVGVLQGTAPDKSSPSPVQSIPSGHRRPTYMLTALETCARVCVAANVGWDGMGWRML